MSLLTSRNNQERLWRIINQNEKITRCFPTIQEKQQWFRHIIGYFDDTFPNVQFMDDLKSVNTQILQYMAQDIKTRFIQVGEFSSATRIPPMLSETPPPNPPDVSSQLPTQLPTQDFSYEEREREYRKLLEKPQPQNIPNFQEEFSTTSISNSDLQQLEQQRTQDISINSVTNPVGAELLELRSQIDTQNKQYQELEKLQALQKQTQTEMRTEMQSEIQQLRNQLETCMEIIKSYQSNATIAVMPALSELQIAEPKTTSDVETTLEEIIVSVESS